MHTMLNIRIRTCGALLKDMKVKDIVIAIGACTDSNYGANFGLKGNISAVPSFKLLKKADEISTKLGLKDRTKFVQIIRLDKNWSSCC